MKKKCKRCKKKERKKEADINTGKIQKLPDTSKDINKKSSLDPKNATATKALSMPSLLDDPVQQNDSNSNQSNIDNLEIKDNLQNNCKMIDLTVDHLVPSTSSHPMPQPIKVYKKHKKNKKHKKSQNNEKEKKRPHSPDENSEPRKHKPIRHGHYPCNREMLLKSGHLKNPEIFEEKLVAYDPWTNIALPNNFPFLRPPLSHDPLNIRTFSSQFNNKSEIPQPGLVNPIENHALQQNITINNNMGLPPAKRKCSHPSQEKLLSKETSFENSTNNSSFTNSEKTLEDHNNIIEPFSKYIVEKVGDSYSIRLADDPSKYIL